MSKSPQHKRPFLDRWSAQVPSPHPHQRLQVYGPACFVAHVLWLAVLLGGISGCLPKTHWVPVQVDPADAPTRYVEAVRVADERDNEIPVIAIKGERAAYYDVGWQLRTLNLREKPLLREQPRPGYVLSIVLPTVFGGLAVMSGLVAGTWALFSGLEGSPFPIGYRH